MSALRTGRLYTPGDTPESTPGPEGLIQWEFPMIPPKIETATFRLVVQSLNQLSQKQSNFENIPRDVKTSKITGYEKNCK